MILNTYGHGDGEVDVRRLLSDAGKLISNQQMFFGTRHQLPPLTTPNYHYHTQACGTTALPAETSCPRTGADTPRRTS